VISRGLSSTLHERQEKEELTRPATDMAPAETLSVTFDGLLPKTLEQLKMLNAAIFPIKYQDGFYRECCASGDVTQLAYHNDVLVAAIACRLELQPDYSAKMYIGTIGVLAPYRGMGLGRKLMERSIGEAQKDPAIRSAFLHVQQTNKDAQEFYKKFGFVETEVVKDYYKLADGRDAVILSRDLTDPAAKK